jgi:hypothetical protein
MTRRSVRQWTLGAASIIAVGVFGSGYAIAQPGPGDREGAQVLNVRHASTAVPRTGNGVFYPPLIVLAPGSPVPTPVTPDHSRKHARTWLPRSGNGVYYPPLIVPAQPRPVAPRRSGGHAPERLPRSGNGLFYPPLIVPATPSPVPAPVVHT